MLWPTPVQQLYMDLLTWVKLKDIGLRSKNLTNFVSFMRKYIQQVLEKHTFCVQFAKVEFLCKVNLGIKSNSKIHFTQILVLISTLIPLLMQFRARIK